MAMTKKEQAEMAAAIDRAEVLSALRWSEKPPERDVMPPLSGYSEGWEYNSHVKRVWPAWSGQVVHGEGPAPKEGQCSLGVSQNARRLYSNKIAALKAMRHDVEKRAAAELLKIDRQIAAELNDLAVGAA